MTITDEATVTRVQLASVTTYSIMLRYFKVSLVLPVSVTTYPLPTADLAIVPWKPRLIHKEQD